MLWVAASSLLVRPPVLRAAVRAAVAVPGLQERYKAIAAAQPQQVAAYAAWLASVVAITGKRPSLIISMKPTRRSAQDVFVAHSEGRRTYCCRAASADTHTGALTTPHCTLWANAAEHRAPRALGRAVHGAKVHAGRLRKRCSNLTWRQS